MAKTLGQTAVQEMTHVSTGPSGLLQEQILNRVHQGPRGSQEGGSFRRTCQAHLGHLGGWCSARPTRAAQPTLTGEEHWNQGGVPKGPGCQGRPVDPMPSLLPPILLSPSTHSGLQNPASWLQAPTTLGKVLFRDHNLLINKWNSLKKPLL